MRKRVIPADILITLVGILLGVAVSPFSLDYSRDILTSALALFSIALAIYTFLFSSYWRHLDAVASMVTQLSVKWDPELCKTVRASVTGYAGDYSLYFSDLVAAGLLFIGSAFFSMHTLFVGKTQVTQAFSFGLLVSATLILLKMLLVHYGNANPSKLFDLEKGRLDHLSQQHQDTTANTKAPATGIGAAITVPSVEQSNTPES